MENKFLKRVGISAGWCDSILCDGRNVTTDRFYVTLFASLKIHSRRAIKNMKKILKKKKKLYVFYCCTLIMSEH